MGITMKEDIRSVVQEYYGEVLKQSADLKTNACCATGAPPRWLRAPLANIHEEVANRFYGCGFPIPEGIEGSTLVDLGCGTGRDVYLLSQLVGQTGFVHGVDMTDKQLEVANQTLGWHMDRFGFKEPNVAFHKAFIEDLSELPIKDGSVDVVVSNCVVNLSPRKDLVMKEIYRILKPGGEFYFSDVFADRRLPEEVAQDPILHSECLGGAMYQADFISLAKRTGFLDPRSIVSAPITIQNDEIQDKVGAARFTSATLRLFKLEGLDDQCEEYGQTATYNGKMPHTGSLFRLDDHHLFEAGRPERVCGNTAAMLEETRFSRYFNVTGDKRVHYGLFTCGQTLAAQQYDEDSGRRRCLLLIIKGSLL